MSQMTTSMFHLPRSQAVNSMTGATVGLGVHIRFMWGLCCSIFSFILYIFCGPLHVILFWLFGPSTNRSWLPLMVSSNLLSYSHCFTIKMSIKTLVLMHLCMHPVLFGWYIFYLF